jgi:hypothetical protein
MENNRKSVFDQVQECQEKLSAFIRDNPNAQAGDLMGLFAAIRPPGVDTQQLLQAISQQRPDREQFEHRLAEAADQIATTHNIKDVTAQRDLLEELHLQKTFLLSEYEFKPGSWTIPSDLTGWKTAHSKLKSLAKRFEVVAKAVKEVIGDPILYGALRHVDRHDRLSNAIGALFELEQIIRAAAAIEGERGRRPNPQWAIQSASTCRIFWREQMHEEPKRYFSTSKESKKGRQDKNKTTEPANAFSRWYCEVMQEVAGFLPSQCDTLLRASARPAHGMAKD